MWERGRGSTNGGVYAREVADDMQTLSTDAHTIISIMGKLSLCILAIAHQCRAARQASRHNASVLYLYGFFITCRNMINKFLE